MATPTPLYMRYSFLEITLQGGSAQAFQFECSTTSIGLVSEGGALTSLTTLCPDGSFSEAAPRTWNLAITAVQDVESAESLMLFLMDHEGETADVRWYAKTDAQKNPVGRGYEGVVKLGVPDQVGGVEAGNYATFTVSLPFQGKPTPVDANGNPVAVVSGAIAGTPGSFTPSSAPIPADLPALQALGALGQSAAWSTGQYVVLGDGAESAWDGSAWIDGPMT